MASVSCTGIVLTDISTPNVCKQQVHPCYIMSVFTIE